MDSNQINKIRDLLQVDFKDSQYDELVKSQDITSQNYVKDSQTDNVTLVESYFIGTDLNNQKDNSSFVESEVLTDQDTSKYQESVSKKGQDWTKFNETIQ